MAHPHPPPTQAQDGPPAPVGQAAVMQRSDARLLTLGAWLHSQAFGPEAAHEGKALQVPAGGVLGAVLGQKQQQQLTSSRPSPCPAIHRAPSDAAMSFFF